MWNSKRPCAFVVQVVITIAAAVIVLVVAIKGIVVTAAAAVVLVSVVVTAATIITTTAAAYYRVILQVVCAQIVHVFKLQLFLYLYTTAMSTAFHSFHCTLLRMVTRKCLPIWCPSH